MSQLIDAFGINGSLILAQAVNFGLLLVVLRLFLYKPVMAMLEKRRALIAQGVEDAQNASERLAGADATATERVNAAEVEAEGIVASARTAAGSEKTRIVSEAEARASKLEADATARAKEAHEKALRDSEKDIARLAILAAEKAMTTMAPTTKGA